MTAVPAACLSFAVLAQAAFAQEEVAQSAAPPAPAATEVEGLVVTGERPDAEVSIDRRSYSVAKTLAGQAGSVADVLRNVPGVQLDPEGNPSLLGQGNVTILVDGRPSSEFNGQALGQVLQAMPADRIDRVEVMTNPPAEYRADGAGGIINLVMKRARGAGRSASGRIKAGSHDLGSAAANAGYNSERASLTADAAYRTQVYTETDVQTLGRTDPSTGAILYRRDVAGDRSTSAFGQGRVALDYDLGERARITAALRYTTTRYDTLYRDRLFDGEGAGALLQDRTGHEREFIGRGQAALTWRQTFGEGQVLSLHGDHQIYHHPYRRLDVLGPGGAIPTSQQVFWNDSSPRTTLTADYERSVAGGAWKMGYDFEYAPKHTDQDTASGSKGGPLTSDPSRHGRFFDTETVNEAYVTYERRFGDLTLLAGVRGKDLRLDLEQERTGERVVHDYVRLYPNLRLGYQFGEGRQLTASFSRRTNVPYSEQLDPLPLSATPTLLQAGNPDLRPEDAYNAELTYADRRGEHAVVGTLFYRETRDAFSSVSTELANATILRTTVNAGAIRRAGGEWSINGKLTEAISYNVSLDAYWIEVRDPNAGPAQSAVTGFGRVGLDWRMTPKDFLQLDVFSTGKTLRPRGYSAPTVSANVGYRRTLSERASLILVVDDPLAMFEYRSVELINGVESRRVRTPSRRAVSLALVWTLAGKPKDTGFEFDTGAGEK